MHYKTIHKHKNELSYLTLTKRVVKKGLGEGGLIFFQNTASGLN